MIRTPMILLGLSLFTIGCGDGSISSNGPTFNSPDFSLLTPACYTPDNSNPIIISGDFAATLALPGTNWNDPHVLKVGSAYWMYASSDDGSFNFDIKIYRLLSSDGINWAPNPTTAILQKSAGQFDSESAETPAVVFFNGQYHMFWTGYSDHTDAKTFRIGHAVSGDGVSFVKNVSALVAPTDPYGVVNFDFNQYVVAEPAPIVFDNKIYLYFTALGVDVTLGTTLQVLGVTTSTDGLSWTTPVLALSPDQTLYPRGAPNYYKGYSTPHAIVLNEEMHLYFDVIRTDAADSAFIQDKLHHAKSNDGFNGWVHDSTSIYDRSDFAWTSSEIRSPAAYLDNQVLKFWFAGHTGLTLGIGYSSCQL